MAHCLLWFKQFRKDPGFCGLSKKAQKIIADYLDIVNELVQLGLPEDQILTHCSSYAVANSGLRLLLPSSETRKQTITEMFLRISNHKRLTKRDIRLMTNLDHWDLDFIDKNCKINERGHAGTLRGATAKSIFEKVSKQKNNPSSNTRGSKPTGPSAVSALYRLNTHGQTNILENMNSAGYGEDIYGAYCIALKWASERLEIEEKERAKKATV